METVVFKQRAVSESNYNVHFGVGKRDLCIGKITNASGTVIDGTKAFAANLERVNIGLGNLLSVKISDNIKFSINYFSDTTSPRIANTGWITESGIFFSPYNYPYINILVTSIDGVELSDFEFVLTVIDEYAKKDITNMLLGRNGYIDAMNNIVPYDNISYIHNYNVSEYSLAVINANCSAVCYICVTKNDGSIVTYQTYKQQILVSLEDAKYLSLSNSNTYQQVSINLI